MDNLPLDSNYLRKALEILGISTGEQAKILDRYTVQIVNYLLFIGGLNGEEIKSLWEEKDLSKLLEKLAELSADQENLTKLEKYREELNAAFLESFAKLAKPEEKQDFVRYLDELSAKIAAS